MVCVAPAYAAGHTQTCQITIVSLGAVVSQSPTCLIAIAKIRIKSDMAKKNIRPIWACLLPPLPTTSIISVWGITPTTPKTMSGGK